MEIPRFAQNYTGRFVSADKDRQKLAGKEVSMDENTGALKGVPFDLAGHVDYSDGSVVSKILLKKDIGNITLFSFDAGQGLSEHTAPFDAVYRSWMGKRKLQSAAKRIRFKPVEC